MDENSKTATVAECEQPFLSGRACLQCAHCEREGKKIAAQLLADPAFRRRLMTGLFKETLELFLKQSREPEPLQEKPDYPACVHCIGDDPRAGLMACDVCKAPICMRCRRKACALIFPLHEEITS
mgnify:CR=1 FL=1